MKTSLRLIIKILIILSPLFLSYLDGIGDKSGLYQTVDLLIAVFIAIPFIAIVGFIISFLTRNRPNADNLSLLGYIIAAVPAWLYYGYLLINHYYIHTAY